MAFFICFASCLILGNADNQQGRGVKCIINYRNGATSLLELILMLLLPLWVMWGVKYFSRDCGAAPQHSFAYQINSRAWLRCQLRQLWYTECTRWCIYKGAIEVYWISCMIQITGTQCLTLNGWFVCGFVPRRCFKWWALPFRMWHIRFEESQVNMVIKINSLAENIIKQEGFHISTASDCSRWFHVLNCIVLINRCIWIVPASIYSEKKK